MSLFDRGILAAGTAQIGKTVNTNLLVKSCC